VLLFFFAYSFSMSALRFPKICVVCCKQCGHDIPSGTDSFPVRAVSVRCSICGEQRRYQPGEVIHGRPHLMKPASAKKKPKTAEHRPWTFKEKRAIAQALVLEFRRPIPPDSHHSARRHA
jgi:hypothetical protein